jgi:hypothetical protein
MPRVALVIVLLAAGHTLIAGQRLGAPAPQGRQGGAAQGRQTGPARDQARPTTGTASIVGRVIAADTGRPVRRAEVQASFSGAPRAVLTDENGRFELHNLPAGRWMMRAAKTGFVPQGFGQRTPFTATEPVVLTDGQQSTADFALTRGAAIMGRVYDEYGDPIASVRVSALRYMTSQNGRRLVSAATSGPTDDTGAFRVYGLPTGEYYLSASLSSNTASRGLLISAAGPVTYAPAYYPGTADLSAAQRLTVRAGEEQSGITMFVTPVRAVRVSGIVLGSTGTPIRARLTLESSMAGGGAPGGTRSAQSAADGTFTIPGVPPGTYVLNATGRASSRNTPADVASFPLTVGGADITGLALTTTRGATITGTIATSNGARVDFAGVRVTAPSMRSGGPGNLRAQANAAGAFELIGLAGVHSLRFEQLPAGWAIESVTANGIDVSDTALEFRGSDQVSVRVVVTNRLTELTGTVRSAAALPRGATVVVFADDPSKWTPVSRFVTTARPGANGQFTLRGLPPATRYLAIALDYVESGEPFDPEFLQRISARAASLSLAEGEKKPLDLDLVLR